MSVERDKFLGYVGPFDVWFDRRGDGDYPLISIVGPAETKVKEGGHNFDTFFVVEDTLERDPNEDLHIGLEDMCLIYQLCVENEIFARRWPSNKEK